MSGKNNDHLTAKDLAKKYKVNYPTVNYYTDIGLLSIVRRQGNRRYYSDKEVRARLETITQMANEGYPLRLIRKKILG